MSDLKADAIRECFDSAIPAIMATADADGVPNVTYLSQVQFIDGDHVALTYQFFNKTRQNILANRQALLLVIHPSTGARFRLRLRYLRTETEGPLFEAMKAKLAGIASHTGMAGVFRLLGSDVFRVLEIRPEPGEALSPPARPNRLAALRLCAQRLQRCRDLEQLLNETLDCLETHFSIGHVMLLFVDGSRSRLYTVASRGYESSGVGSEIAVGEGVIGVAALERTPIRVTHMTSEYGYSRAIRDDIAGSELASALESEIPFPGLAAPGSQLAVPILAFQGLHGVLCVESEQEMRFTYDDEDALVALAAQLGMALHILQQQPDAADESAPATPDGQAASGPALRVRHYRENDSIFFDDDYLIKGVAGSILWTLLNDHVLQGRTDFSNRELRLDERIRLPDIGDNLEARLILLARRLAERQAPVQIVKTGRGRLQLRVRRPVELIEL